MRLTPRSTLFPYTTLFRSHRTHDRDARSDLRLDRGRGNRRGDGQDGLAGGQYGPDLAQEDAEVLRDRKSTRLNSSHVEISYAVFCLKKKKIINQTHNTTVT